MTVADLIRALASFPPDTPVTIPNDLGEYLSGPRGDRRDPEPELMTWGNPAEAVVYL